MRCIPRIMHRVPTSLRWRHNGRDSVSNHQPHDCLLNRLFRRRSKKTIELRVTGLCEGNSPGPVNSPHKWPVTRKMFPFDDVIIYLCSAVTHVLQGYWQANVQSHVHTSEDIPLQWHHMNSIEAFQIPATRLFKRLLQVSNKENMKVLYHWPFLKGLHW